MNWKEQFNQFVINDYLIEPPNRKAVEDFISTEIVERLIAEIPDVFLPPNASFTMQDKKQQLRDKWL